MGQLKLLNACCLPRLKALLSHDDALCHPIPHHMIPAKHVTYPHPPLTQSLSVINPPYWYEQISHSQYTDTHEDDIIPEGFQNVPRR